MSTTDPDARALAIGTRLQFLALPACLVGVLIAPVLAAINWTIGSPEATIAPFLLGYVVVSVGAGLLIYYLPNRPGALATAAYLVAYVGGLFLVMASFSPADDPETFGPPFWFVIVLYATAIALAVLQRLRTLAVKVTADRGIDTTGTITRAGVDGMVNYVQHQRLTVKFTDKTGTDRWVRIGRTGGGYSVGDTVPVRYDPERPWSKRSIVVGN